MAKYSIGSDTTLSPNVTYIAMVVDAPSMRAIESGPTNLQTRSIRRIRALSSAGKRLAKPITNVEMGPECAMAFQYCLTLQSKLVSASYDDGLCG